MTAWVIPIGAEFPGHWTIARDHGAWDLTRGAAIEPSDDVIFWLGGASVLAWVRATSSATSPIPRRPITPWEDRETSRYVARFTFTTISEDPVGAPSWGQVRENIEAQSGLNRGPVRVDGTKGIHYLRSLFRAQPERALPAAGRQLRSVDTPGTDLARSLVAIDTEYEHSDTDARRRVLSAVVRRRGQQEFRGRLWRPTEAGVRSQGPVPLRFLKLRISTPTRATTRSMSETGSCCGATSTPCSTCTSSLRRRGSWSRWHPSCGVPSMGVITSSGCGYPVTRRSTQMRTRLPGTANDVRGTPWRSATGERLP